MTLTPEDLSRLSSNPRASLSAWTLFYPVVQKALSVYPQPYSFTPSSLRPSTFASRIRDAIRGAIAFDYPPIPLGTLLPWWDSVIVTHDATTVTIKRPRRDTVPLETSPVEAGFVFDTLTSSELDAFLLLLNNNRILGPLKVKFPPSFSNPHPNLAVTVRPDGSLFIL